MSLEEKLEEFFSKVKGGLSSLLKVIEINSNLFSFLRTIARNNPTSAEVVGVAIYTLFNVGSLAVYTVPWDLLNPPKEVVMMNYRLSEDVELSLVRKKPIPLSYFFMRRDLWKNYISVVLLPPLGHFKMANSLQYFLNNEIVCVREKYSEDEPKIYEVCFNGDAVNELNGKIVFNPGKIKQISLNLRGNNSYRSVTRGGPFQDTFNRDDERLANSIINNFFNRSY